MSAERGDLVQHRDLGLLRPTSLLSRGSAAPASHLDLVLTNVASPASIRAQSNRPFDPTKALRVRMNVLPGSCLGSPCRSS